MVKEKIDLQKSLDWYRKEGIETYPYRDIYVAVRMIIPEFENNRPKNIEGLRKRIIEEDLHISEIYDITTGETVQKIKYSEHCELFVKGVSKNGV